LYDEILTLHGYKEEAIDEIASPLKLTIETFIFAIGTKHDLNSKGKYENGVLVDLKNVHKCYVPDTDSVLQKPTLPSRLTKDGKVRKTMYNQIEFKGYLLEDGRTEESKLSIMIFTNGAIKVTGIRNPKTIIKISICVLDELTKHAGSLLYIDQEDQSVPEKQVKIWGTRPAMINTVFKLRLGQKGKGSILRKKVLQDILNDNYVDTETDKTKPILRVTNRKFQMNIKFKGTDSNEIAHVTRKGRKKCLNEVTILIFFTGYLSIIGTTNPGSIKKAYSFICNTINNHPEVFLKPRRRDEPIMTPSTN
jgi:hypothetical protein